MLHQRQSGHCVILVLAKPPGLGFEGAALLEGGDTAPFSMRSAKTSSDYVGFSIAFLSVDVMLVSQFCAPLSPLLEWKGRSGRVL